MPATNGLRASQSIPLNIAEATANAAPSIADDLRYCTRLGVGVAAIQDVLGASAGLDSDARREMKLKRKRIVSMLTPDNNVI